jgi:hypothetical protein
MKELKGKGFGFIASLYEKTKAEAHGKSFRGKTLRRFRTELN